MSKRRLITALVIVAALAALAIINYVYQMDPSQLAARGVGRDPHSHEEHQEEEEAESPASPRVPEPIGPIDAPVNIQVVYNDLAMVEEAYHPLMEALVRDYGDNLRIEYINARNVTTPGADVTLPGGLLSGLIINGEIVKDVPGTAWGVVSFTGSPMTHDWSTRDLRLAVENELRKKGVAFTSRIDNPTPASPADDASASPHFQGS